MKNAREQADLRQVIWRNILCTEKGAAPIIGTAAFVRKRRHGKISSRRAFKGRAWVRRALLVHSFLGHSGTGLMISS